jgi:hypothetical protein
MFSSLRGCKVFWVSLILCVPSSAVIPLLTASFANGSLPLTLNQGVLNVLTIGAIIGLFKSLIVSGVTFFVKPSLRQWLIIGSTVALSLLEAWSYYEIWTAPIAHAG